MHCCLDALVGIPTAVAQLYYRSSRDLKSHAVLYFLTYEYSWGQLMGY
jgi:hypothetical protein